MKKVAITALLTIVAIFIYFNFIYESEYVIKFAEIDKTVICNKRNGKGQLPIKFRYENRDISLSLPTDECYMYSKDAYIPVKFIPGNIRATIKLYRERVFNFIDVLLIFVVLGLIIYIID